MSGAVRRCAWTGLVWLAVLGLPTAAATAAEPREALEFIDGSPLVVEFDPGATQVTVSVAVENAGTERTEVAFATLLQRDGTSLEPSPVTVTPDHPDIPANSVDWFVLTLGLPGDADGLSGVLTASADGAEPAGRPIELREHQPVFGLSFRGFRWGIDAFPWGPAGVVLASLVAGAVFVGARRAAGRYDKPTMGDRRWSFAESTVTTVTAFGTVLVLVLSLGLGPAEGGLLGLAQYAGLAVLFATLVAVGGLWFDAVRDRRGNGTRGSFFVAMFLVFAAAIGELLTMMLLVLDASRALGSTFLTLAFLFVLIGALVALLRYGWRAIDETYQAGTKDVRLLPRGATAAPGAEGEDLTPGKQPWLMP